MRRSTPAGGYRSSNGPIGVRYAGPVNEIYDHILHLRAVRSFEDRRVSDDDLRRILEAARWTGSSKNRQNWAFVVITDAEEKARLADTGNFTDPLRNAPAAIAIVQEPEGYEFDTGRAAQNMMLAASAIGVASCPVTLHRDDEAGRVLGLPLGARCRYALAVGYPGPPPGSSGFGGRKPLDELVHHEHYGS
jgi:nitroreductase